MGSNPNSRYGGGGGGYYAPPNYPSYASSTGSPVIGGMMGEPGGGGGGMGMGMGMGTGVGGAMTGLYVRPGGSSSPVPRSSSPPMMSTSPIRSSANRSNPNGPNLYRGGKVRTWISVPMIGLFLFLTMIMFLNKERMGSFLQLSGGSGRMISEKGATLVTGQELPGTGREGVSLVVVCMNRQDTMKEVIKFWLDVKDIDEVILVDWNSDPPLQTITKKVKDPRFVLVRVNDEESWVLSRAYNIGMSMATRDKILKLDCDYALDPDFIKKHPLDPSKKIFYSGDYGKARNENEVHLNGVLYIRRDDFWGILGYDERIQTYGWDDEDLYVRLNRSGLTRTVANYDLVLHYPHGDAARSQKGVKFPQVEVDVNRLLLEESKLWSKTTGTDCSQYTVMRSKPGVLELSAKATPLSLQKRSPEDLVKKAYDTALGRRLHDDYGIPWDILSQMEFEDKETLLGDFISLSGRTGVGDVVNAKGLLLHVTGSPVKRILSVIYGNALAQASHRALLVIWEDAAHGTDDNCKASFADVFDRVVGTVAKMSTKYPFTNAHTWDDKWSDIVGIDLTAGASEQKKLATVDPKKSLYIKAQRFVFQGKSKIEPLPLSIDVQKAYGALGTAGGIGLVVSSTSDLGDLSAALKEERQKMPSAKVFIVTKSSDVISALAKEVPQSQLIPGKSHVDCQKDPTSKACAISVATDVGALGAAAVIIARQGNDYAIAASTFQGATVHFV